MEASKEMTFVEATSLIESLKPGMRVRVVRHGGTPAVMTVTRGPHRSNGAFGDAYSLAVTLSFGPGRYITDVAVDHLVRRRGRGGRGWIGGGTAMELAE